MTYRKPSLRTSTFINHFAALAYWVNQGIFNIAKQTAAAIDSKWIYDPKVIDNTKR